MTYLLDTDVLSELCKLSPKRSVVRRVAAVPRTEQATSSVTVGELIFGAFHNVAYTALLLERIAGILPVDLPIIPFDDAAARIYGELRWRLERAGTPIGDADTRISRRSRSWATSRS